MIDHSCTLARRMADRLHAAPDVAILNDVVLNQVLVRFSPPGGGDAAATDDFTRKVIAAVQADGMSWAGGTTWHGMAATEADADLSVDAMLRCAREVGAAGEAPRVWRDLSARRAG